MEVREARPFDNEVQFVVLIPRILLDILAPEWGVVGYVSIISNEIKAYTCGVITSSILYAKA